MGRKKKPFIDKKKAHKFELVHRSQRDPLQADDGTSERVLLPVESASAAQHLEEQHKYGIFYDDDYDYMQHLKPRGEGILVSAAESSGVDQGNSSFTTEVPSDLPAANRGHVTFQKFGSVILPSTVFASSYEEEEGLLSKGLLPVGPQPDWDPDIVAALDDGLDLNDPENILEDDFMLVANAPAQDECESVTYYMKNDAYSSDEEYGSERDSDDSDYPSDEADFEDREFDFNKEETQSRFTQFSMTSSVIRRTQELQILDERFDKILESYDEDHIGGLDDEEISGALTTDNPLLGAAIEEMDSHDQTQTAIKLTEMDENQEDLNNDQVESDDVNNLYLETFNETPKEQWDCESILSTYSNLYNHPKLIREPVKPKQIKLTKTLGIPEGVLQQTQNSKSPDKNLKACREAVSTRPKKETSEEKKQRKKAVKGVRRERREEKKANKIAFKAEKKNQEKIFANTQVQQVVKM